MTDQKVTIQRIKREDGVYLFRATWGWGGLIAEEPTADLAYSILQAAVEEYWDRRSKQSINFI
jgi:hypothetical protein